MGVRPGDWLTALELLTEALNQLDMLTRRVGVLDELITADRQDQNGAGAGHELRDWYAARDAVNSWSTPVLEHHIATGLHRRLGTAPSNFTHHLEPVDADQAQEIVMTSHYSGPFWQTCFYRNGLAKVRAASTIEGCVRSSLSTPTTM